MLPSLDLLNLYLKKGNRAAFLQVLEELTVRCTNLENIFPNETGIHEALARGCAAWIAAKVPDWRSRTTLPITVETFGLLGDCAQEERAFSPQDVLFYVQMAEMPEPWWASVSNELEKLYHEEQRTKQWEK